METLRELALRLDEAADEVGDAARRVTRVEPSAEVFGAAAPGVLGEQGRELHGRWLAMIGARAREAASVAARLTDTATAVRDAADRYADIDHSARRRHHDADETARHRQDGRG